MQTVPFHISYLLTQHEYVCVPGLGAFVVFPSEKGTSSKWGILSPPENTIEFNPEIKHNDGLLATSIAKEKFCSYEEANLLIEQYVNQLLQSLDEGEKVYIPWVGSLFSNNDKKFFQPERVLSCNAFNYGLTSFSLPSVKDIQQQMDSSKKRKRDTVQIPFGRKLILYAGSAAAALLAMCIIPTPLNIGNYNPTDAQYASLINLSIQKTPPVEPSIPIDTTATTPQKDTIPPPTLPSETPKQSNSPIAAKIKTPTPSSETPKQSNPPKVVKVRHYVVITSLPDMSSAKKTLSKVRAMGFLDAAILTTDGRFRIYTNSFKNKVQAEKYLNRLRKDYPEYADAWLLTQEY